MAQVGGGLGPGRLVWLRLDATAAQAALQLAGQAVTPEVWEMVKAIAAGAAEELNG